MNPVSEASRDWNVFDRMASEVGDCAEAFPVTFSKARGSTLYDGTGRCYLDFCSGAGTLNYGHNNPVLRERMRAYLARDGVAHDLDVNARAKHDVHARNDFAQSLGRLVLEPRRLDYILRFPGPSETNAIEAALELARRATGRQNVISFAHGFHGMSGGSLAATTDRSLHEAAGATLGNISFMPYDGYFGPDVNTMAYLERMLDDPDSGLDHPAAVIVETVQGEDGVNVASQCWLRELERLCRRHDMLLIVDDIQVGCGRAGGFFSFEAAGISPDIVILSKSLSGFGLPLSLLLLRPALGAWWTGTDSRTEGNDLAFVAATQVLETYWADGTLSRKIEAKERLVRDWLENLAHSCQDAGLGVRGRGLIQALVVPVGDDLAGQIARRAFEQGVVIETAGAHDEVLKVLPALTIPDEQLQRGLEIIERSVDDILACQGRRPRPGPGPGSP